MFERVAKWLWRWTAPTSDAPQEPAPEAAAASTELQDLLFEQTEKAYDRESEENEGLWRSLPVFAASFGFAVALLGYGAASAPVPSLRWDRIITYLLLVSSVGSFAWSFKWFWQVVRPRQFRYLSPEPELLSYAESLRQYHLQVGASETDADTRALREFKLFLTMERAQAAAHNQGWNQKRAYARGRTVFYLMMCICLSLVANAVTLISKKSDTMSAKEVPRDVVERSTESAAAP